MVACRSWRESVLVTLALLVVPAPAYAQDQQAATDTQTTTQDQQGTDLQQSCRCILPPSDIALPVGEVMSVAGDVMMSQNTGYNGPVAGAPVVQGSIIRTGLNSSVALRFQDICFIDAPAGTTISVQPIDQGICVAVSEPPKPVPPPPANAGSSTNMGIVAVVAGVGAAGVGVALGLSGGGGGGDDDDGVPASE